MTSMSALAYSSLSKILGSIVLISTVIPATVLRCSSNLSCSAGDTAKTPFLVFMMNTFFKFVSWQLIVPYSAVVNMP